MASKSLEIQTHVQGVANVTCYTSSVKRFCATLYTKSSGRPTKCEVRICTKESCHLEMRYGRGGQCNTELNTPSPSFPTL